MQKQQVRILCYLIKGSHCQLSTNNNYLYKSVVKWYHFRQLYKLLTKMNSQQKRIYLSIIQRRSENKTVLPSTSHSCIQQLNWKGKSLGGNPFIVGTHPRPQVFKVSIQRFPQDFLGGGIRRVQCKQVNNYKLLFVMQRQNKSVPVPTFVQVSLEIYFFITLFNRKVLFCKITLSSFNCKRKVCRNFKDYFKTLLNELVLQQVGVYYCRWATRVSHQ
eukprot:TRINITY_DN10289_c0_g1_i3.p1 TRINITY_DN10289_c0_g1~~TRINITY_DN10289_c0_g1_i3.p1  ORF type:complete len:217 (-),score=-15.91 TRINITY_DN10289_c0_g1_i3:12-662(-)